MVCVCEVKGVNGTAETYEDEVDETGTAEDAAV